MKEGEMNGTTVGGFIEQLSKYRTDARLTFLSGLYEATSVSPLGEDRVDVKLQQIVVPTRRQRNRGNPPT